MDLLLKQGKVIIFIDFVEPSVHLRFSLQITFYVFSRLIEMLSLAKVEHAIKQIMVTSGSRLQKHTKAFLNVRFFGVFFFCCFFLFLQ